MDEEQNEERPRGGTYRVVLTWTDVPRAAVEHTIEDVCRNGDFPAEADELEVVEETENDKWTY